MARWPIMSATRSGSAAAAASMIVPMFIGGSIQG
jgi:hypothetical protein